MDPKKIEQLRRLAIGKAHRSGLFSDAEDIAQEFVLARSSGSTRSIEQVLVDYYRKEYGDARTKVGRTRKKSRSGFVPIDSVQVASAPTPSSIEPLLIGLQPIDRAAIVLRYVWGFTFDEIGALFGFTNVWAKKRIERAQVRIRRALTARS